METVESVRIRQTDDSLVGEAWSHPRVRQRQMQRRRMTSDGLMSSGQVARPIHKLEDGGDDPSRYSLLRHSASRACKGGQIPWRS